MDIGGDDGVPQEGVDQDDVQPSGLNISDVIEAIRCADPAYSMADQAPSVRIVEQPASKALRFRYPCEGRSAGSIPGANSTSDNKTFPAIEITGHKGRAIVVVSCVNKDPPYLVHPHNLVGRENCRHGVYTVNVDISPESSVVTFNNLGIQCVKRKDIEEALKKREEMRVDPYRQGFKHREHPQTIDLNAVRLCFQVFLERDGRFRTPLRPCVSDVIYDKKAMSDLAITKLSHRTASVAGGQEVILLCEKVAKDDIGVTFTEMEGDRVVWSADCVDVYVHKQVAIHFKTPRYRDINVEDTVKVLAQLKRPSDDKRSDPVVFELKPLSEGTRRKQPDLSLLSLLLSDNPSSHTSPDSNNNRRKEPVSSTSDSASVDSGSAVIADSISNIEMIDSVTSDDKETLAADDVNEKSLNELLDQVAELDEIYSENRTRLENAAHSMHVDNDDSDDFNDAGTYTSLQLAFKNPVMINEPELEPESFPYEDVQTYRGPIIEFTQLKRDTEDAPPLPPKRVRKTPSVEAFKTSQTSVESLLKPGKQIPITGKFTVLDRDRKESSVARSEPALPRAPKKRSFFSRLFRRRDKSPAPSVKSEGNKKDKKSKPVGRSVSSVSGVRPSKFKSAVSHTSLKDNASGTGLSYADSITHISLHGDENEKSSSQWSLRRPASLAPLPPTDGGTILVAESVLALDANAFKKLQDDLDLTEAEHYALYMAVAPHATASEFDETSCYYAPVDGSKFNN